MRLIVWALVIVGMSLGASADETSPEQKWHNWVELGVGTVSVVEFKSTAGNLGWGLSYADYEDDILEFDSHTDRYSQKPINHVVSEMAVMLVYSKHGSWFYSDLGVGVGYMDATLPHNCEKSTTGMLGDSYLCDKERTKGLSLPMELDVAIGRYAGIGLKLRATIGVESTAGATLIIPLGGFAKH